MITIQHNVLTGVIISGEINMPTAGNVVEFFTPPVWFVDLDVDPNDSKKWLYEFEVPSEGVAAIGFSIKVSSGDPTVVDTGIITINATGVIDREICCNDKIFNVAWMDSLGWRNYIFTGVRTYKVEAGNNKTYKNSLRELKYSERTDVYNAELVTSGFVEQYDVDYTASLKYSVQAFLWNAATEKFDTPILIKPESFNKYKDKQKLFEISFEFIYATEKLIQSQ